MFNVAILDGGGDGRVACSYSSTIHVDVVKSKSILVKLNCTQLEKSR